MAHHLDALDLELLPGAAEDLLEGADPGKWVDVAAPGVSVYSTFPNHPFVLGTQNNRSTGYDIASGTSMASPVVAGVAALVWSKNVNAGNAAVRDPVELTADPIAGTGSLWANGRVNAYRALGGALPGV